MNADGKDDSVSNDGGRSSRRSSEDQEENENSLVSSFFFKIHAICHLNNTKIGTLVWLGQ